MNDQTQVAIGAAEIIGLIISPDSPYAKDHLWHYKDHFRDAEKIIQRVIDKQDVETMKLKMESVSAANEICNWQSLCKKREAEIERLKSENESMHRFAREEMQREVWYWQGDDYDFPES